MENKCSIWFCNDKAYAKGLCRAHYTNLGRYGMPIAPHNKDVIRMVKKLKENGAPHIADWANIYEIYDSIQQYESRVTQ